MSRFRIVVGISGASGAALAVRVVERLAGIDAAEVHLVASRAAERTFRQELGPGALSRLATLVDRFHEPDDVGACIASGSFQTAGMIVVPCSMNSLAAIAVGLGNNLLVRSADVHLKERRRVVLLPRETPLHLIHLRNMCAVTDMGAVVMPPVPAFYHRLETLDEVVDQIAARAIDLLALPVPQQARAWEG